MPLPAMGGDSTFSRTARSRARGPGARGYTVSRPPQHQLTRADRGGGTQESCAQPSRNHTASQKTGRGPGAGRSCPARLHCLPLSAPNIPAMAMGRHEPISSHGHRRGERKALPTVGEGCLVGDDFLAEGSSSEVAHHNHVRCRTPTEDSPHHRASKPARQTTDAGHRARCNKYPQRNGGPKPPQASSCSLAFFQVRRWQSSHLSDARRKSCIITLAMRMTAPSAVLCLLVCPKRVRPM